MKNLVVAGVLLAFAGAACAEDPFPRRFKPDQYSQVVDLIEEKMKAGGELAATPEEQAAVRNELAGLAKVLEGNERLADLDATEKAAIDRHRQAINAILADNGAAPAADQQVTQDQPRKKRRGVLDHLAVDARPVE
jgi:hypothetical protein